MNPVESTKITDKQIHDIYEGLADADKTSTDNLKAATEETELSSYDKNDNNVIEAQDIIPGVNAVPSNLHSDIKESDDDIMDIINSYGISDDSAIKMLDVIREYQNGDASNLYSKLPEEFRKMCDGIVSTSTTTATLPNQIRAMRNAAAKMLIDEFIHDSKLTSAVNEYNTDLAKTIEDMNSEYDNMMGSAIDNAFKRIEEIRSEDPDKANRIQSVKDAFESAISFDRQIEFASHVSKKKLDKWLNRYKDSVFYFNKTVNNNSIGVKVPDINNIVPIIAAALPQYKEDDIKKFVIVISKTIPSTDPDELYAISYVYRMISSIYKYNFTTIDEKGEEIFGNISKAIDAILS